MVCLLLTLTIFLVKPFEAREVNDSSNFEYDVELDFNQTSKLNGIVINVTTVEEFPFTYISYDEAGKIVGGGAAFKVLDILADKHNFTYQVIRPTNNYFYNVSVGLETALGLLLTEKVDMIVGFIPPMRELEKYADYSFPLHFGRYYIMASRPASADVKRGLLAPFDWTTWICTLVSVILISPLMYWIVKMRGWLCEENDSEYSLTLGQLSWFVYGALFRQGSIINFKHDPIRIIVAAWWIFVTILTSFYTADLIAYLSSYSVQRNVQGLEQIMASGAQLVAYEGSSVFYSIIEEDPRIAPFKDRVRLIPPIQIGSGNDEIKDLEQKVVKKNLAIIRDYFSAQHFMYDYYLSVMKNVSNHADPCPFVISQSPLAWLPQSFVYRRGSLLKILDPAIRNLFEMGITKMLRSEGLPTDSDICAVPKTGMDKKSWTDDNYLKIKDLHRIFTVAFIGLTIALVVFICERLKERKRKLNERRLRTPKITVDVFTIE